MALSLIQSPLLGVFSVHNFRLWKKSCANGTLQIYNWGEFGHPSDMLPGHDPGDLCLARLNEKVVLTGDFRGNIRPVNIQPNRIMGILGVHQRNTPIECLDTYKGELALSVGTGTFCIITVKFQFEYFLTLFHHKNNVIFYAKLRLLFFIKLLQHFGYRYFYFFENKNVEISMPWKPDEDW